MGINEAEEALRCLPELKGNSSVIPAASNPSQVLSSHNNFVFLIQLRRMLTRDLVKLFS